MLEKFEYTHSFILLLSFSFLPALRFHPVAKVRTNKS